MDFSNQSILNLYEEELTQTLPAQMDILFPPFNEIDSLESRFENTQKSLIRSIKMKNRILALSNAYFLGLLLNNSIIEKGKPNPKKKITDYYKVMARHVYDVFESNPSHLLYTRIMKVQEIKKLKRNEIIYFRNLVSNMAFQSIFDGAQNLEEENC